MVLRVEHIWPKSELIVVISSIDLLHASSVAMVVPINAIFSGGKQTILSLFIFLNMLFTIIVWF